MNQIHGREIQIQFHFKDKDCLFGGVKLAKNVDPDNYVYSGYSIGFDSC